MSVNLAASVHGRLLNRAKTAQWRAFLGKNRLTAPELAEVIADIRQRLEELLSLVRQQKGKPNGN